jgi:ABC-type branched-subunit amino acid transport system permease subunit
VTLDIGIWTFYLVTLGAYFVIYNILTWGLNIQFGYAGIPNFTYITFMAVGAYFSGVVGIGPSTNPRYVQYILGFNWPWPLTMLFGATVAAILGALLGFVVLNRLRSDYLAIVTFSLGFIAYDFVASYLPLFNGYEGIAGVQLPLTDALHVDYNGSQLVFLGVGAVIAAILFFVAQRIYNSPIGRTMRAIREDIDVAEALGKNTFKFRMIALVVGCFYAGIGGALTIEFVSSMNPSGWTAPETFIIWAALLVGGRGNNIGVMVGSILVPITLFELTRFIPISAEHPILLEGLRFMLVGSLLILVLWFRPQGALPERKRFYEIPLVDKGAKA